MFKQSPTILLAEDDPQLGKLLVQYLEGEGFSVQLCPDGESALTQYKKRPFDLCLLDVMLPKIDGFELAQNIRKHNRQIPFIFLTAKSMKEDKLKGYDLGADDYITKPFDADELVWKMKALLRRKGEDHLESRKDITSIGRFQFDFTNQSLCIDGRTKRLTEKENQILKYLWQYRNQVVKREDLLKDLWGEDDYFLGRSLDVFISKLRRYLSEDSSLSIETIFGVGFIFNIPAGD